MALLRAFKGIFGDFFWKFRPENCPKTARKTCQNHPKIPPEAFPEDPEIANKPVRTLPVSVLKWALSVLNHRFFAEGGSETFTGFDRESKSEVENLEILHPDLEIKENHVYRSIFPRFSD